MKKILAFVLTALLFTSCAPADKPELVRDSPDTVKISAPEPPAADTVIDHSPMKAVWISYIELSQMISGHTAAEFADAFSVVCSNSSSLGINTLFVHVRAFSDSLYDSELFPKSALFDTEDFDALRIMTDTAHSFGLAFHAWINPLRCAAKDNAGIYEHSVIGKWIADPVTYDEYICFLEGDGHYWLDPAVPEVRELIVQGAAEIVRGYDVDGIHIDDYFYPTDEPFFDAGRYVESGTTLSLSDWRLENCSQMVKQIRSAVKRENSAVLFGISPQGNIDNNYTYLCADVRRWATEEGFADYIVPQIYYGYDNPKKPFTEALDEWTALCRDSRVRLVVGIAAYKLSSESEYINDTGILGRQLTDALERTDGAAVYSYKSLFDAPDDRVKAELECIKKAFLEKNPQNP